ncbi:MAG: nucleotidyltransferase family protein [Acidobacteria bacterium]|nr:nucleotidyltransferase family protein [Acidobacteriota bacterium]
MSRRARPAATLEQLFRAALPSRLQTLLLRAALAEEEGARKEAFLAWARLGGGTVASLASGPTAARTLAPLLWAGVRHAQDAVPTELGTYLRAATDRAQERTVLYGRILAGLVDTLARHDVPFAVLKGAALAWTVYPAPWQRHCHDIDLLVPPENHRDAVEAARSAGFDFPEPASRLVEGTHPSGLPLTLHTAPYRAPLHNGDLPGLWDRRIRRTVAERPVHTLVPEDALLHVLVHAACGSRRNGLLWVSDAVLLARANPAPDWEAFVRRAAATGAAGPVSLVAAYLVRELQAPIPPSVPDTLSATPQSALAHRVNLLAVARTLGWRRAAGLLPGPAARAGLVLRLLFPAPSTLAAAGEAHSGLRGWTTYPHHLLRPLLRRRARP